MCSKSLIVSLPLLALLGSLVLLTQIGSVASDSSCADARGVENSTDAIYHEELREVDLVKVDLLQLKKQATPGTEAIGGDHKYLLVRPCQRWAGDGMSGLARHRVTGECCGDGKCSKNRWETFETCRLDCADTERPANLSKTLPPTESTLFGTLEGIEHQEYHCESGYDEKGLLHGCSRLTRTESVWLEDLLARSKDNTLPFELPPPGSTALEFGCGLGQDSRNIAAQAGYSLTSIDVSATAIEEAKQNTPEEMKGSGAAQIEFVAYDAFALPAPSKPLDYFFDATVYCGMRSTHLSRSFDVWARLFTPGHTLVNIQCWASETDEPHKIGKARRDMEADFEPMFDILHSEACEKNQGGPGWCFYMHMKPLATREQTAQKRLKLQQAAHDGDMELVRGELLKRLVNSTDAEYWNLYYIARDNGHPWTLGPTLREDKYWQFAYGNDLEDKSSIIAEDLVDGQESFHARMEVERLKKEWERAELGEVAMRNQHMKELSYDHELGA